MNKLQIRVKRNMKYLSKLRPDLKRRDIKKDAIWCAKAWFKYNDI